MKPLKFLLKTVAVMLLLVIAIIVVRAFDARRMPDLKMWHRACLESEFRAEHNVPGFTYKDYRAMENALFKELDREVYERVDPVEDLLFSRYHPESPSNPRRFSRDWNRSFELTPPLVKGGALLIHGLTDSPYSLKKAGEVLHDQGFYVLGMRMPGHGTTPGELTEVNWPDWMAAVMVGARHVLDRIDAGQPFFMLGYSTGGALAVKYALDGLENPEQAAPDRLILFSPAIGVTPFALFADWHKVLSFIPYFEKFKWTAVEPEYDPFKYTSFPKNGGEQIHRLTRSLKEQIARMHEQGRLSECPPITTFQSLVDTTVLTDAIVHDLYDKLNSPRSELVLFDINRAAPIRPFLKSTHEDLLTELNGRGQLPYRLTLITNSEEDPFSIVEKSRPAEGQEIVARPLGLRWPSQVYSLSHLAIPFSPEDGVYGDGRGQSETGRFSLGSLAPRGERNLLRISMREFMRLRYNPFFEYVRNRLAAIAASAKANGEASGSPPEGG
ncbi:MAG: alpha/beta fold hydrolase [Deltaproteobacteria bacterium]|nr:alpha/beta fold hydrolase [Deltaproteobacteria bacterium]MBW2284410.1 alpha/beta fold hydrolase [Deltaproteobacteria bacterium]